MENENNSFVENSKCNFKKNVFLILFSNIVSIITGILTGFLIPKMLGVNDYGYYKTFTLYISYIGLFSFGFCDGIYLYYAGKKYEYLDKKKFRTLSKFFIIFQVVVALGISLIAMFFIGNELCLIIFFVALDLIACSVNGYYEIISQITMRFKTVSIRSFIKSCLTILCVVILFILYRWFDKTINYYIYLIIIITINFILAFWYMFTYRGITFGKNESLKSEKKEIKFLFKLGFPLLVTNLIGQLIFVIDQQIVNIFFGTDTYSAYAFAYTMINLITVATSAVSIVIYPTLKIMDEKRVTESYSTMNAILMIFVAGCFTCYFLLVPFIKYFLPEYTSSLGTFRIILPGVMISSCIQVIKYNCFKKFDLIHNYLVKSIIVFVIAIITDLLVYYIVGTTDAISIVSIGVLFIWYILIEYTMIKKFKVKWLKNLIYSILSIAIFYIATFIPNTFLGLAVYFILFIANTCVVYNRDLVSIFKIVLKR